ncbi:GNAT family N-acetyltransferase [Pseudoalteromonas luteoviolacea]|uniref:GNAT family N-acetyltransferase n=1 Tax=Pseudoalteromonas luteoviolacea TaxID=43657 RepID=UPI001F2471CE|nr:GNAT family N-acetyltransferase [Pseudoalteromonas luteoviolacea]MCF6440013.1 GNAT family N-acetyltransferase [Pseudoalteromonas luteoviolacea]
MQLINQLSQSQFKQVHAFLSERSYWSKGITAERLQAAIDNSLCFALVQNNQLIAFARVVTDCATFANLLDVFVLEPFRGMGHGKQLLDAVVTHPKLQGLRRFTLVTHDAHTLYRQFGFDDVQSPEFLMERYIPAAYKPAS